MIDIRPAGFVVGWLVGLLGTTMALPMAVDLLDGAQNAKAFLLSMLLTIFAGTSIALACGRQSRRDLDLRQGFLLITMAWLGFTGFATLPLMLGAPDLSYTDAFFETMSAMTTTGATVLVGLETLPRSVLLWRGLLQWVGGIGVILLAMILLPVLNIGGMQLLRNADFNTVDKIVPRAKELAAAFGSLYAILTLGCALGYGWAGMSAFDAVVHAMTTISTGGMANYDTSFAGFTPAAQYVAMGFMLIGATSFVRFVQLGRGEVAPILQDTQVRTFLAVTAVLCAALLVVRLGSDPVLSEAMVREVMFNLISIITTTGYSTTDYQLWGGVAVMIFFCAGLICGCSGSTTGGPKVFRYQLMIAAVADEVRHLHSPSSVHKMRYQGRSVSEGIINSVIAFFMLYFLTLGIGSLVFVFLGLTPITAISAAATCLSNVGPGLGSEIGPVGNFAGLPDAAKWVSSALMLVGRLELLTVYVLFTSGFWRS